jgi:predicted CXXCH cytochrome family protein
VGKEYAGSAACAECHGEVYGKWSKSHHAQAERPVELALDGPAFREQGPIQHGDQVSAVRETDGLLELVTNGPGGKRAPFEALRAFGYQPLRQYLVDMGGGRLQVTELAYEPASGQWFNVFGDENRRSGEWGHWTGRGMNWNSMCAACHNTAVKKRYSPQDDEYDTQFVEHGVGCEACHGPLAGHAAARRAGAPAGEAAPQAIDPARMLDTCGTCHARRSDLTESFLPGEHFLDHYSLVIPDLSETYYADGQVQGEDFEFASFLGSRMHGEGVTCGDCHDPHQGSLLAPGNQLCLRCHAGKIEPDSHSHHAPGTPGHGCIDCHMPITVYMERDPRRDHGFTVPDPALTLESGVPNACGRCHLDREPSWVADRAQEWYGERLKRRSARRSRLISRARSGSRDITEELLALLAEEPSALWRAVLIGIGEVALGDPRLRAALLDALDDPSALVRERAARTLEPFVAAGDGESAKAIGQLLDDPLRAVRLSAAWALRGMDHGTPAAREAAAELRFFLDLHQDQPTGAWQKAVYHLATGDTAAAETLMRRASSWDPTSPAYPHDLAVLLAGEGRALEAREVLEQASARCTDDANLWLSLALARNETGDLEGAVAAFETALDLDPKNARAWYNLGLAHSAAGDEERALECLARCQALEPSSPAPAWARATILYRQGRLAETAAALDLVLRLAPEHAGARELLGLLNGR